ncbi:transcriptional regulator with XRE-family HTH domain [Crossiella equi]|uniref:Transcriptional regulator with XRE-family HTH domain n=1 Tax=Crossiella equi TaxID=130796 RepID=A0ABS5AQR6_9PSEU|nr:helix-turn-helix domain-containing protein [Crossiella equi]MBP2478901.1 transcriptional regulator with XRE-family HTH domain [Crossiella equi]
MADNALGAFLRARRESTTPASVGLPEVGRRRTPGLRRAELAARADISVEYLTRLERGHDRHPSAQVIGTLAEALLLSPDERVHLHRLVKTGGAPTPCAQLGEPTPPRPTLLALLARLDDTPACLSTADGTILAHTKAFGQLAEPVGLLAAGNLPRYVFTDTRARTTFPDWSDLADRQAAGLRAAAGLGDGAAAALVEELTITGGAEFTRRYAASGTLPPATGVLRWRGPDGVRRLAYETLVVPGEEEHRLVAYLPAAGTG